MTALAVTSQFVDFAKLSYFSMKAVTFVPSKLGAPGMCGSGMRSVPRASIASTSVICAEFMTAVAVSSVSSMSPAFSLWSVASLVYRRSGVACRVQCVDRVVCRRLLSPAVVYCVFSIVCAPRLSLCLLTVLCSAFRLKIRLRAPFVVK